MGWKIGDKITVDPGDNDLVPLQQGENTRNSTLARIKKFFLGDEKLKTTAQTITGAINENTAQMSDMEQQTNTIVDNKYRMTFNKNQLGVNIQNPMDLSVLQSKFALMKEIGIHNIILCPQGNLATSTSTSITEDTISYENIENYTKACLDAGFNVYYKLHIECKDSTWRANIAPSDISTFFTNYQNFIVKYATLAEKYNLSIFCLGEEMISITKSTYQSNWQSIVSAVRNVYTGKLTYGANLILWDDEYLHNVVYDLVDYLGVDLWAQQNIVSGGRIDNYKNINGWCIPQLESIYQSKGKKIIVTEVGYFPTLEGAYLPNDSSSQTWGSLDYNLQAQYYDIMFSNFIGQEWLEDIWYWAESNNSYTESASNPSILDRYSVLNSNNTATQKIFEAYKGV